MAPTAALLQEKFKTARSGCRQPGNVANELSELAAPKCIYNTMGDGEDNSGEGPQLVSRQMQDAGVTINALAFGPSETLDAYLRQNVTGGLGSFVMRVRGTDDIAASYRAKFILDISMVQQ